MLRFIVRRLATSGSSSAVPNLYPRKTGRVAANKIQLQIAASVHESLEKTFSSRIVKDRGFDDGLAVHIIDVQVSKGIGNLARVLWEPLDDNYDVKTIETTLKRRRGVLQGYTNSYINRVSVGIHQNIMYYCHRFFLRRRSRARSDLLSQKEAVKLEFIRACDADGEGGAMQQISRKAQMFDMMQRDMEEREQRRSELEREETKRQEALDLDKQAE